MWRTVFRPDLVLDYGAMAEQSIFHNVVKAEPAYTQLLCNLLKRDKNFRSAFLCKIGIGDEVVSASDIEAEVYLNGNGRADIRIKTKTVCVIIEIKTEFVRGLEDTQLLDTKKERCYRIYLEAQKKAGIRAILVFLIPAAWKYSADIEEMIKAYKEKSGPDVIEVDHPVTWEDMIHLLRECEGMYLADFKVFLEERFGPVVFDKSEVMVMEDESFPIELFVKLVKFLDDLRLQINLQPKKGLEIQKSEIGFGAVFGEEQETYFWVGFWPEFWRKKRKLLCFGIKDAPDHVRLAFSESFKEEYGFDVTNGPDRYLMGFVPSNDLLGPGKFEEAKAKIKKIWQETSKPVV